MPRHIIHIDITDFPIAVERVLEPRLRDRPVAVAVEKASRSLIVAASAEARQNGIYRGLPLNQARRRCKDVTILPPNEDLYQRATRAMLDIMNRFTPIIEPLRFGHAYLDMTGGSNFFGGVKDVAYKAQHDIRKQLRLDAVAGVAANKLVSKVASDMIVQAKTNDNLCDVKWGDEERFLAPLKINYLPGIDKKIRTELLDLNVRFVKELAALQVEHLQMIFGRKGMLLHQRARGIDNRPVKPPQRSPEIVERLTLAHDSNDMNFLLAELYTLLAQATQRLRTPHWQTRRIVIKVVYSDYKENVAQQRISPLNTETELAPVVEQIFERALNRRVRVRSITLRLLDLCRTTRQLSLFPPNPDPRIEAVAHTVERIRKRFGNHAIRFGRAA